MCVFPSTETWPSLIASSRALWVRGVVRLISSARITLAKIGPGLKVNSPDGGVVDARAEDVRGEQVGRELEPAERAVDAGGHGPGQQGLAHPGDVLDQDVPLGQQGDHGQLDDFGLAEDDRSDVVEEPVQERREVGRAEFGRLGDERRIHARSFEYGRGPRRIRTRLDREYKRPRPVFPTVRESARRARRPPARVECPGRASILIEIVPTRQARIDARASRGWVESWPKSAATSSSWPIGSRAAPTLRSLRGLARRGSDASGIDSRRALPLGPGRSRPRRPDRVPRPRPALATPLGGPRPRPRRRAGPRPAHARPLEPDGRGRRWRSPSAGGFPISWTWRSSPAGIAGSA